MTKNIPEGFCTITPSLVVKGAAEAIELYKKVFGAKEVHRVETPDKSGKIMHACIRIGNSNVFLADANPDMGCNTPSVSSFYVYLEDVDAVFQQAIKEDLTELWWVEDMFWGDRVGTVKDSFGITWTLATHMYDVPDKEFKAYAAANLGKAL